MSAGRIPVNVRLARRKNILKSTGSTTVQNGKGSEGDPTSFQKVGAKREDFEGGVEVAKRYF